MKAFLLAVVLLVSGEMVLGQTYSINTATWNGGTRSDPPGYTITNIVGVIKRYNGATYNHYNPTFRVVKDKYLTQFNEADFPNPIGVIGQNRDFFLFQGTNEIIGDSGVIVFDTVYFNIGAGNTMNITNSNMGMYNDSLDNEEDIVVYQPPGSIVVGARLYFNNGITNTNRSKPVQGAIVFPNNADYVGGLTDAQHVNGFVSEVNYPFVPDQPEGHNGAFTYPVGNGNLVYQLTRSGTFNAIDRTITVGWVEGDPDVTADPTNPSAGINHTTGSFLGGSISSITKIGFWDWHIQSIEEEEFNPLSLPHPQSITVAIPDFTGLPGLSPADLRLVGFNESTNKWEDLSGGPNAVSLAKGSLLSGTIPAGVTIKALAVGSINAILPVSFVSFSVKGDGCKVKLQWQTGMEQNNSHFVVERSSNGQQFTTIARVESVGNSNSLQTYHFTDDAPVTGAVNYYRVTQVDFDGKQKSTDVRSIRMQCDGSAVALRAYPNPVSNQLNIQTGKTVVQVNVLTTNGQPVLKHVPSRNTGGTFSISMHAVQSGIYLLQLINKDGTTDVLKLVKQ
ncbi:MAG: T9SS type A sorting domain-containing protein [Chitinophagaceae bacterium]|nr:T9SS type A sorting domain-containing protein [Chitinophagaceae bacterium]